MDPVDKTPNSIQEQRFGKGMDVDRVHNPSSIQSVVRQNLPYSQNGIFPTAATTPLPPFILQGPQGPFGNQFNFPCLSYPFILQSHPSNRLPFQNTPFLPTDIHHAPPFTNMNTQTPSPLLSAANADTICAKCKEMLDSQIVPMQISSATPPGKRCRGRTIGMVSFMPFTVLGECSAKHENSYELGAFKIMLNPKELNFPNEFQKNLKCDLEITSVESISQQIPIKFNLHIKNSLLEIAIPEQTLSTPLAKTLTMRANRHTNKNYALHTLQATFNFQKHNKIIAISSKLALLAGQSFQANKSHYNYFQDKVNFLDWFKFLYDQRVLCTEYVNEIQVLPREFKNNLLPACFRTDSSNPTYTAPNNEATQIYNNVFQNNVLVAKAVYSPDAEMSETPLDEDEVFLAQVIDNPKNLHENPIKLKRKVRNIKPIQNDLPAKRPKFDIAIESEAQPKNPEIQINKVVSSTKSCGFGVLPLEILPFKGSLEKYQKDIFQKAVLFAYAARNFENINAFAYELSNPNNAEKRKNIREGKIKLSAIPENDPLFFMRKIELAANKLDFQEISRKCAIEIYTISEKGYCLYSQTENNIGKTLLRFSMREHSTSNGKFDIYDVLQDLPITPLQNKPAASQMISEINSKDSKEHFGIIPLEMPPSTKNPSADIIARYNHAVLFAYAARNFKDSVKLAFELAKPENAKLRKEISERGLSAFSQEQNQSLHLLDKIKSATNDLNLEAISKECIVEIYTANESGYHHYKTINEKGSIRVRIFKNENSGKFISYDVLLSDK